MGFALLVALASLAGPARAQTEASLGDVLAGTAVPHTVKLKDLTPEWRRVSLTGEALLGMGGTLQSMLQSVGSMFGGSGGSDAIYTRGAVLKIGDQQFLVGYRLPSPGMDFGALMAMGMGAAGKEGPGAPPKPAPTSPVTPDSELSLVLVNVRSIASISDIRPFNLAEATKPPGPGLMELMKSVPPTATPPRKPAPANPPKKRPQR
jgi:hypothetical protein